MGHLSDHPDEDPAAKLDHLIVLAGGDDLSPTRLAQAAGIAAGADLVIAADSGFRHASALGRSVDVLVGDLDSISDADLRRAEDGPTRIERHPADKDLTDLALALDIALRTAAGSLTTRVTVVGGDGGRTDHLLGNALLMGAERYAALRIDALWGDATLQVVRDTCSFAREDGALVSLLALHGPAHGITTDGLAFPLRDASLLPGSSLGLSNRLTGLTAQVSLESGILLAVQPGTAYDRP
jgi:thiamine pyrophosphokinase